MKYDEYIDKIVESKVEDWLYDDEIGLYTFKDDISITMQQDRDDDTEFYENWVKNFSHHPTATKMRVYLCYNGNIIDTFYTATVDEARMYIPYPKIEDMSITYKQYKIGRIINIRTCGVIDRYDEYLKTAKIKYLEQ